MKIHPILTSALLLASFGLQLSPAQAASSKVKLCISANGSISARARCRRTEVELTSASLTGATGASGTNGSNGTNGTNGTNGADGQQRIFGNGSAGVPNLSAGGTILLSTIEPNGNYQFTDFTIPVGVTLQVANGTVLRVSGTFINNGTLEVYTSNGSYGAGNFLSGTTSGANVSVAMYDAPGVSFTGDNASAGAFGDNTGTRLGGRGGRGTSLDEIINFTHPGILAGGGGSGGLLNGGGFGGGSVTILAKGAITNSTGASILANGGLGQTGSAGGGGGIVILASQTSITNSGSIFAQGGAGGGCSAQDGAAGGGGGGLVRYIAPLAITGTINVSAGVGGAACPAGTISGVRAGGAGGGGSYGNGGQGASAQTDGSSLAGSAGIPGLSLVTIADPSAFF